MTIIMNLIIAVLLIITTASVSAAVTTYAAQRGMERNYALLEERYVELHSHMMQEQVADYMMPMEY